jgi:LuxR family transcriptional activator of bioluminescence operon
MGTSMNLQHLDALTQHIAVSTTLDDLEGLCRTECARLGFHTFVYALRVPTHFAEARVIMLDGYPAGWVKRYFEAAHFEADPVMAHCTNHIIPLRWSDLSLEAGSHAERVMREAATFGLRDGVTMPVHSPRGELGILSFALDAPPEEARAVCGRAIPYVHLLASHVHEAVRRLSGLLCSDVNGPALSAREIECLRWAADGKTSSEIAQLLGLSESTINFHLNNTVRKLEVVNRQQAVAKATLQGLIQPLPF